MTAIEQVIKDAWTAGYKTGIAHSGSLDIPTDWFFEKYMEEIVADLQGETHER
jgi:hypothetical protein